MIPCDVRVGGSPSSLMATRPKHASCSFSTEGKLPRLRYNASTARFPEGYAAQSLIQCDSFGIHSRFLEVHGELRQGSGGD